MLCHWQSGETLALCDQGGIMNRNLGDPFVSSAISRTELPGYQLQALTAHSSVEERT